MYCKLYSTKVKFTRTLNIPTLTPILDTSIFNHSKDVVTNLVNDGKNMGSEFLLNNAIEMLSITEKKLKQENITSTTIAVSINIGVMNVSITKNLE